MDFNQSWHFSISSCEQLYPLHSKQVFVPREHPCTEFNFLMTILRSISALSLMYCFHPNSCPIQPIQMSARVLSKSVRPSNLSNGATLSPDFCSHCFSSQADFCLAHGSAFNDSNCLLSESHMHPASCIFWSKRSRCSLVAG